MRVLWVLLLFYLHAAHADYYRVRLGDEVVTIQKQHRGIGKNFVHLHQNETTALKAARILVATEGGSLLTLIHSGQRNIVFHLHKKRYEFDPNRIFTDAGIKKTLSQFGPYNLAAHHEVKKLSAQIKRLLPKGKIIAVHNNREYSLQDYLPGHSLCSDVQALHVHSKPNYRNFFLVTQEVDFLRLKNLKFNSAWQAKAATDDGSLSIYLAQQKYINVEAGYDQLPAQIKMLRHA